MEDKINYYQQNLKEAHAELSKTFKHAEADLRTIGKVLPPQFHKDLTYFTEKIDELGKQLNNYKKQLKTKGLTGFDSRRAAKLMDKLSLLCGIQNQWFITKIDDFVSESETADGSKALKNLTSPFLRELNDFPKI